MGTLDSIERWLEWPEWAKDAVATHVEVHLGWRDRLLVLVGRPILVTAKAMTEHAVGRTEGRSQVRVPRIRWPWSRRPPFSVVDQASAPEPRP